MNRLLCILFTLTCSLSATNWYVATTGSSGNAGSLASPWDLPTGLSSASVQAGDTVWLRGGTYTSGATGDLRPNGVWTTGRSGSSGNPITIRNYNGERAILDSGHRSVYNAVGVLSVPTNYVRVWGLEIISSDTGSRSSTDCVDVGNPTDIYRMSAFYVFGVGNKIINNVLHDNSQGIGFWMTDSVNDSNEAYGNVIYNNGWDSPLVAVCPGSDQRGHAHGIYTQNQLGMKVIKDNISFNNFFGGIQVYTGGGKWIDHFDIQGNILFNNGFPSAANNPGSTGFAKNLVMGGSPDVAYVCGSNSSSTTPCDWTISNNYTYFDPIGNGTNNIGLTSGVNDAVLTGNYWVHGYPAVNLSEAPFGTCTTGEWTFTSNFVDGPVPTSCPPGNVFAATYPSNTYYNYWQGANPPPTNGTVDAVFVRPNTYETGRANIVIFNFSLAASKSVSLSTTGLITGQAYEIRDVQNWFGTPVATGTYSGANATINLGDTSATISAMIPSSPNSAIAHTSKQFGAFVVLPTSAAAASTSTLVTGKVTLSGKVTN